MGFKEYISHAACGSAGIGDTLRSKRIAQGVSLFAMAHELGVGVSIIEAVEAEDWHRLPKGRERAYTKLIAERLSVDLDLFLEQWDQLPGAIDQEAVDRYRELPERVLVSVTMACSLILLLWLVMPGPNLKHQMHAEILKKEANLMTPSWRLKEPTSPYPVVGEVLPEVPVNSDGVIVSMRAMDTCEAIIKQCKNTGNSNNCPEQRRTLLVSEPWSLRVKGPFTIFLDNAGVVAIEVAGRRIRNGCTVGKSWLGQFGPNGEWLVPEDKLPKKHTHSAPESDQETTELD